MKASASGYGMSGSGEYSRTDYQERRKDRALSGVLIIAVIAVIGFIVYMIMKGLNPLKTVTDKIADLRQTSVSAVVAGANSDTTEATSAMNVNGGYYPVKTLTQTDYENMLNKLGIARIAVDTGNIVTPPVILGAASQAGAEVATTVNKLGLNDAYVDLPLLQKGLVTLGAGVGKIFGADVIQMGYDMRSDVKSASGVVNQPVNQTERSAADIYAEYYAGMT